MALVLTIRLFSVGKYCFSVLVFVENDGLVFNLGIPHFASEMRFLKSVHNWRRNRRVPKKIVSQNIHKNCFKFFCANLCGHVRNISYLIIQKIVGFLVKKIYLFNKSENPWWCSVILYNVLSLETALTPRHRTLYSTNCNVPQKFPTKCKNCISPACIEEKEIVFTIFGHLLLGFGK